MGIPKFTPDLNWVKMQNSNKYHARKAKKTLDLAKQLSSNHKVVSKGFSPGFKRVQIKILMNLLSVR